MLVCQASQGARAEAVVLDRLLRVPLHHGHMFMCRRMKDHIRFGIADDLLHPVFVRDVGHQGLKRRKGLEAGKFLFDEK